MADKKYEGLKQLINAWASYENEYPTGDLQAFARYLLNAPTSQTPTEQEFFRVPSLAEVDPEFQGGHENKHRFAAENNIEFEPPLEGVIGYLLGKLMRIIRQGSRELLQKVGIGSYDEFSLLATIHTLGSTTRAEACSVNTMEPTTGGEIIKRLILAGLIEEETNPADRRAKHIRLTPAGARTAFAAYHEMWLMSTQILTPLSVTDRRQLLSTLQKIMKHYYHVS